jgi:signal transduction histidine kinase
MSEIITIGGVRLDGGPVAQSVEVGHFSHSVQFYGENSYLLDGLSNFIGSAILAGDPAVVIATKPQLDVLSQRLRSRGLDVTPALQQGRYIMLDAEETLAKFMVDGWPDATKFSESIGSVLAQVSAAAGGRHREISAFGEMVALLWSQGNPEAAIRLEQLWNGLSKIYSLNLRCGYPMSAFDRADHADLFLKICAEHSEVIPVETYTVLVSDEQKLRSISRLQQKAQALENEIAERKKVEEELRAAKAHLESMVEQRTSALRQLSSRLLTLQDTERRRVARELHDSLGQYLVGLKLNVEMLRQAPNREELWAESEQLMQQCIIEVRTLSYLLHPPTMDAAGFASAARWYVEGYGQRCGLHVTLDAPENMGRLSDALELALFRVLQEALTNVHRHSGASAAQVTIREELGQVILEVQDNGHGMHADLLRRFEATGAGMGVGLAGIRERARELGGTLKVESNGGGTSVRVVIPIVPLVAVQSLELE